MVGVFMTWKLANAINQDLFVPESRLLDTFRTPLLWGPSSVRYQCGVRGAPVAVSGLLADRV